MDKCTWGIKSEMVRMKERKREKERKKERKRNRQR